MSCFCFDQVHHSHMMHWIDERQFLETSRIPFFPLKESLKEGALSFFELWYGVHKVVYFVPGKHVICGNARSSGAPANQNPSIGKSERPTFGYPNFASFQTSRDYHSHRQPTRESFLLVVIRPPASTTNRPSAPRLDRFQNGYLGRYNRYCRGRITMVRC